MWPQPGDHDVRIGLDAKRAFANRTGLGTYSRLLIGGLSRLAPDWEFFLFTPPVRQPLISQDILDRDNVRVFTARTPLWRRLGLGRSARRQKCHVFHGLSHELPLFLGDMPSVVTMHDMLPFVHPELFPAIDRAVYRKKFRHACSVADLVLAVSEHTRQDVINILGVDLAKVRVQHQAISPRFFAPVADKEPTLARHGLDRPYILSVGAIIERKNLLTLVKAFQGAGFDKDLLLVVVGRGRAYEREVREFVTENSLQDRVRFLRHAPVEELPALYSGAELLAYPSSYEGFGLPIAEALACNTPV
ncbi:MAG: glycosyltransferase family 1 protein, partial [Desulfovibrio sp.]